MSEDDKSRMGGWRSWEGLQLQAGWSQWAHSGKTRKRMGSASGLVVVGHCQALPLVSGPMRKGWCLPIRRQVLGAKHRAGHTVGAQSIPADCRGAWMVRGTSWGIYTRRVHSSSPP